MNAKLEHRAPLSGRAVVVLDEARAIADRSGGFGAVPGTNVLVSIRPT